MRYAKQFEEALGGRNHRLLNDDDWDFGPNIKKRAEQVLAEGGLPDYPEEMTETFKKLLEEHNIDTTKYLG